MRKVNDHKNRPRRTPHGAWQTFCYDLLLEGGKQINDRIMKRHTHTKNKKIADEKQTGTPTSNASLQVRQPCIRDHTTTRPHKPLTHTKKRERKSEGGSGGWSLRCVFVCSWVWARLQLRGEAIAIPTDLKTSLQATSKYKRMGPKKKKKREERKRENVSEHEGDENTGDLETLKRCRHCGGKDFEEKKVHTARCSEGLPGGTGLNASFVVWRLEWKGAEVRQDGEKDGWTEENRGRDHVWGNCNTPKRTKKTQKQKQRLSVSVWVWSHVGACPPIVPVFRFCDWRGSPRSRADPLSLSCPLFIHSPPPPPPLSSFSYTHSSSPPSLLVRRWMALSRRWVTDEWSSPLKSRVTARPVKRGEMPDKRRQRETERERERERKGKEEREGGRGERSRREPWKKGRYSTRENVKRRTSIKSARDGGRLCVCVRVCGGKEWERVSVVCIFLHEPLGGILHCWRSTCKSAGDTRKAGSKAVARVGTGLASLWNRPSGVPGTSRDKSLGIWNASVWRQTGTNRLLVAKIVETSRQQFPLSNTFGGFLIVSVAVQSLFGPSVND